MNQAVKYLVIISAFLWIGFVGAISFMEAWLKFQAPGVSLELGLGIGKLVFSALNKVEWVLAIIILINLLILRENFFSLKNLLFAVPLIFLVIQSFWLLPALDLRADQQIQGDQLAASNLHFYYVGMEIIKVVCLFLFGIKYLKLVHVRTQR